MIRILWPVILTFALGACSETMLEQHHTGRATAPFFFVHNDRPSTGDRYLEDEGEVYRPMQELNISRQYDDDESLAQGYAPGYAPVEPAMPAGCSIRDRFDNSGALAYNFSNQSRLSLNLDMGNVGFGGVEVDKVMVKFRYKFQPGKDKKEACRYPSRYQGLVPSAYHELFQRQHNTVWDEIRDKNPLGLFD